MTSITGRTTILIITSFICTVIATETNSTTISSEGHAQPADIQAKTPAVPEAQLSRWTVLWCFIGLAANALLQHSGSDESPAPYSLSLARVSPLICLADMVVAATTISYGCSNHLGIRGGCALYIKNSRRTVPEKTDLMGPRTIVDVLLFLVGGFCVFKIFAAKNAPMAIVFWTSIFFAAPMVHFITRILAESNQAQDDAQTWVRSGGCKTLLQAADVLWCLAYTVQFCWWIRTFQRVGNLPLLSGPHTIRMNAGLMALILSATVISCASSQRLFQHWSLANWKPTQWRECGKALFVLCLATGASNDRNTFNRWQNNILLPLGALGVVVLELWLITLLTDFLDFIQRFCKAGPDQIQPKEEPSIDVPESLEDRWNPLLSTAPTYWRGLLLVAFAFCQLTFTALYYAFLYDAGKATEPAWIEGLGR